MIQCPGCGGTNPRDALSCEWCRRSFLRSYKRGLSARWWGTLSGVIIGVLVVFILGLSALNGMRTSARIAAVAPTPSPLPLPPLRVASPGPTSGPTPSTVPAVVSAPSPIPSNTPLTRTARVTSGGQGGANLRREPSMTSPLVTVVPEGAAVRILGPEQRSADGQLWRQVEDSRGQQGWMVATALVETAASGR
jgi:hypothetical protein